MVGLKSSWFVSVGLLGGLAILACSSDNAPPGSGAGSSSGSSSGSSGSGSSSSGSGSGSSSGGVPDSGPPDLDAAPGAACPARTTGTDAVHIIMGVTWPGSVGTNPGSGTVHVWTRSKLTYGANNAITAVNTPCGSQVPDIQTTPIAGGAKVQPEFLPAVWESAAMGTAQATGTQSSFDVNSKVNIVSAPVLVGLSMTDPNAAWPAATAIQAVDSDGDGHPAITATPKSTAGYGLPPTSILQTNHADLLYIASRITSTLTGVRDTCDSQKGAAQVAAFDSHVVGCHIKGGGDCAPADSKFVDDNRTVYKVTGATFEAKTVSDTATCADVRAALPAH